MESWPFHTNNEAAIIARYDNVAVAKRPIGRGSVVRLNGFEIRVMDDIAAGQRFAIRDIEGGELLNQYGWPFGISNGIKGGALVSPSSMRRHQEDIREMAERRIESLRGVSRFTPPVFTDIGRTFDGYARQDGRAGTRNFYLVVPSSLCASDVASKIAATSGSVARGIEGIDGVVAAAHTEGCGCNDGEIIERLITVLKNTIMHPNVGGALIVDLGCEKVHGNDLMDALGDPKTAGKPVDALSIQASGGTRRAIEKGREVVLSRLAEVSSVKRRPLPLSLLSAGLECGASDTFSGLTANPLIGKTVDRLVSGGGSAMLSEVPEMLGAEALLLSRMNAAETVERFVKGVEYYRSIAEGLGVSMDGNFVYGNEKGGLLNPALKSLGAVLKGGEAEIVSFLEYGETIKEQGLSLMNGPGNDLESMTGIVAGGANIILFSTGMGATEGNLIAPVIKISSTTGLFRRMDEDIDFDAGPLLDGEITLDEMSGRLMDLTVDVASGKKTWAEQWEKRSFQIWSAGKLSL
ncbi:MAG: UxaA family hydrolase [Deltaproteobacteria bacterium]|nr:UxaA family hydrolase [Deltaproteobacteria bacterium]